MPPAFLGLVKVCPTPTVGITPWMQTHVWIQTPLDAGQVTCDACWEANNPPPPDAGHVTCDARWEANSPENKMTDTRKDITLSKTLFAGGNNELMTGQIKLDGPLCVIVVCL